LTLIPFRTINRAALILKPRQPFFEWVNSHSLSKLEPGRPTYDFSIYLVEEAGIDIDPRAAVAQHYKRLFELELADALQDRAHWPTIRDLNTFSNWFDVEMHSMVVDLLTKPIRHEEFGA